MNAKARTLLLALDHLRDGATIVEVGCIRAGHEVPSDGFSTVYLAAHARPKGWKVHSVDVDPVAVAHASLLTEGLGNDVNNADGAAWLRTCGLTIDGLYLDGSADPQQAVEQYQAATLAASAVVVVDDVQAFNGNEHGKGDLLLDRLRDDGFTVTIWDTEPGYRMAVANR